MNSIKRKLISVVLALTVSMTMSSAIVFADSTDAVASDSNTTSESQNVKDNSNKEQTEEATKDNNDNNKNKSDAVKSDTVKTEQNANGLKITTGSQKLASANNSSDIQIGFMCNGGCFEGVTPGYNKFIHGRLYGADLHELMDILQPEKISREGYKFVGWSPELEYTVTKSVNYYAQWEKLYTVTYDFDGGLDSAGESSKIFNDICEGDATPTVEEPTKEGYDFAGWNTTVADTVSDDVTYTAQWKQKIPDYDKDKDNDKYNDDKDKKDNKDTDINKDTDNNSNINDSNGLTKSDKYYTAYVKETTEKAKEKKESKKDDSAKTGDNMPIGMLFGLMAVAASGGVLTLGKRRKEQE